jgi:hypothetical protein
MRAAPPFDLRRAAARLSRVRRGRAWRIGAVAVAALLGGWVGLALGGQVTTPVGPADVRFTVSPSWTGETVLDVAPLGRLEFDTHAAPLRFEAAIAEIRLSAAEEMFENPEAIDRMAASIGTELRDGVVRLFAQAAGAAVLGAVLAALLVFRDWRRSLWSGLTALLTFAAAGGLAAWTFNPSAIAEPRYSGLLARAPRRSSAAPRTSSTGSPSTASSWPDWSATCRSCTRRRRPCPCTRTTAPRSGCCTCPTSTSTRRPGASSARSRSSSGSI